MEAYIQNVIDLLNDAIENEDWSLITEAKNLLESEDSFEEFEDLDYQGMKQIRLVIMMYRVQVNNKTIIGNEYQYMAAAQLVAHHTRLR